MLNVLYLPLDDRPCNTLFPSCLARIAGIDLKQLKSLRDLETTLRKSDLFLVALDRWVYGGLVESRLGKLSLQEAKQRIKTLCLLLRKAKKETVAFSVLLRQAPTAFTEHEARLASLVKEASMLYKDKKKFRNLISRLPKGLWVKYLSTRKRNFMVNQEAVLCVKKKVIDFLSIALDDLSASGLNQAERCQIEKLIHKGKLHSRILILPGTDEMGMLLLARALLKKVSATPKIYLLYSHPNPDDFRLRYEDRRLTEIINLQCKLLGAEMVKDAKDADLFLFVHSPQEDQKDVPAEPSFSVEPEWLEKFKRFLNEGKRCILADLRFANGADRSLMRNLSLSLPISRLYGFSAWNTTANALGIALSHGVVSWFSELYGKQTDGAKKAHKAFLFLRFLEDWFYQAEIRPKLLLEINPRQGSLLFLNTKLKDWCAKKVQKEFFQLSKTFLKNHFPPLRAVKVEFPWNRLFEINVTCETE